MATAAVGQKKHNVAIGYLRATATLIVVLFHCVNAYMPSEGGPWTTMWTYPRGWISSPIRGNESWIGFPWVNCYINTFLMALMYFISGLFVWKSLKRKGSKEFLRGRAKRLAIPFFAVLMFQPFFTYYPTYLGTGANPNPAAFVREWFALGEWPLGPLWFIWLLLAFNMLIAGAYWLKPGWTTALIHWIMRISSERPATFFVLILTASLTLYYPMAVYFGPSKWTGIWPFWFESAGVVNYIIYFLAGVGVGAAGVDRGLLSPDGRLARSWLLLSLCSLCYFHLTCDVLMDEVRDSTYVNRLWSVPCYATCCVLTCAAFVAVFVRFCKRANDIMDSISDNAYGIHLTHYITMSWVQFMFVGAALPGLLKGFLVTLNAIVFAWAVVSTVRRIPAVARVV